MLYWFNKKPSQFPEYCPEYLLTDFGVETEVGTLVVEENDNSFDQQISIYSHHSSPMNITTGTISPFRRMDISYKRKVSDKFNFTVKLKDVFDTGGFSIKTDQTQDMVGQYYADPINNFPVIFILYSKFSGVTPQDGGSQ